MWALPLDLEESNDQASASLKIKLFDEFPAALQGFLFARGADVPVAILPNLW
jgi:hypothetical protein